MNCITKWDLEKLLRSRPLVPASEDLAERIVMTARSRKQLSSPLYLQWMYGLFTEFLHFKPAYAMGPLLVFGLSLGFSGIASFKQQDGSVQAAHMQDYFYSTRSYL